MGPEALEESAGHRQAIYRLRVLPAGPMDPAAQMGRADPMGQGDRDRKVRSTSVPRFPSLYSRFPMT